MHKNLLTFSVCCIPFVVAGCSTDKSPSLGDASTVPDGASTGGEGGASGDGAAGKASGGADGGKTDGGKTDGGDTVVVSGVAIDFGTGDITKNFDATKYPALPGVDVCVYEMPAIACVKTGADGKYSLPGVPAGVTVYLSYEKADYTPNLYGITATAGTNIDAPALLMTTVKYTEDFGTKGGGAVDAKSGTILFGATQLGPASTPVHEFFGATELFYVEGFSASISPAAKLGPIFTSATWEPDPALKTSSIAGWGFFQAAPGDYTLTITHPSMKCGTTTTKVVAGYSTTYVGTLCTPNADGGAADGSAGPADAGSD
jgi:hypothetical protein